MAQLETRLFAYLRATESDLIQTGDLVENLGLSVAQETKLLSRLSRRGVLTRVRRGLYLAPKRILMGGKWSPGEALAVTTLMNDRAATYQVCGPNAFSRYGWDEQIPNRVYVYNNRISGERQIGPVSLTLIKVADARLGDTETISAPDGIGLLYSSRVRSLLDAVYDWSRFNTLPRAYSWIRQELRTNAMTAATLTEDALRFGNQSTIRRIGRLFQDAQISPPLLRKLKGGLRPTSSLIAWNPTSPKRGKIDRDWGLVVNWESDANDA